jgi:hypothetical protein
VRIPQIPLPFNKLMAGLEKPEQILKVFQAVGDSTCDGRYLHWDEIRFRKPPEGLTHQD